MARIRNIKPRFWDSPDTAKADLAVRLLYMALWNWADDSGRGTANLKELEAFAFPHDVVSELPRKSFRNSAALWPNFGSILAGVQKCYGVVFYRVDRRNYYEIPSFGDHQSKHFKSDSLLPSPDDGELWDLTSEFPDPDMTTGEPSAESRQESRRNSAASRRTLPLDKDGDWDEDMDGDVVYDDARVPAHIDNAARPAKRQPSSSSKTLVRQELGNDYPRTMVDRLAIQVENLLREGQPDTRIREALHEWDRRPNCNKPEFLPTVLADIVKKSRSTATDLTPGEAKVVGWAQLGKPGSDQRKAIGQ